MIKKKKLLSAGCSLIYGAELSDSLDFSGRDKLSSKTWPALLSQYLNYDYYSAAVCGLSNQGIVRYVIDACENYNFDVVIVQWTFCHRYELRLNKKYNHFHDPSYYCNISPWMANNETIFKSFGLLEKIHHLKDSIDMVPSTIKKLAQQWFFHIDCNETALYNYLKCNVELGTYLKWKNIPFIFSNADYSPRTIDIENANDGSMHSLFKICQNFPTNDFENLGFYYWAKEKNFPFGISHPTDEAHFAAFEYFLRNFLNKIA